MEEAHLLSHDTAPHVSVVIPSLRGGPYLRQAVDSVFEQTLHDWELIIVADGCDDPMEDITSADHRVRVIRQRNRGESTSRNVGVRAARSDLVAFLDDDDRMLPERLMIQVEALRTDPQAALCHCQFRIIDSEGNPSAAGYGANIGYDDLLRCNISILTPTAVFRKRVLEEVGTYDSAMRTEADLDVLFRIAREHRLIFVPEILYEYRRHGSNASNDLLTANLSLEAIITKHLRFAERNGEDGSAASARSGIRLARLRAAREAIISARQAWNDSDLVTATRFLGRAAQLSPTETVSDLLGNRFPRFLRRANRSA